MRLQRLAAALLFALPAGLAAHGDHGKPEPPRPLDGLGASAAFDADGVLWAVSKGGHHVILHHSKDAGRTWSWGKAVNLAPESVDAEGQARPKVATGPKGELFVSWTQTLAKPGAGKIRFARSLDRGTTFSAPVTVHADRHDNVQRFDTLAVDRDGRVFIAWWTAGKPPAIRYAVSEDRGASFRGDFKVADSACAIALLARSDGGVIAFWQHAFGQGVRDQAIAGLSPDGRIDAVRRATFDQAKSVACHGQPSLAQDGDGALHAVWPMPAGGAAYGRLRDGGVDGARSVGSAKSAGPDLAIAGNRLALAWSETYGERSTLVAMRSDDGGTSWRRIEVASTAGAADQPRILVRDRSFHVFWNTRAAQRTVHALP